MNARHAQCQRFPGLNDPLQHPKPEIHSLAVVRRGRELQHAVLLVRDGGQHVDLHLERAAGAGGCGDGRGRSGIGAALVGGVVGAGASIVDRLEIDEPGSAGVGADALFRVDGCLDDEAEARNSGLDRGVCERSAYRERRHGCTAYHRRAQPAWLSCSRRSGALRQAFFECSEKAAPWGSTALRMRSPPGTSIGPLMTCPPFAVMRCTAASTSGTRK
jgi:hypothetical protein